MMRRISVVMSRGHRKFDAYLNRLAEPKEADSRNLHRPLHFSVTRLGPRLWLPRGFRKFTSMQIAIFRPGRPNRISVLALGLFLGVTLGGCSGDGDTPPPRESVASDFVRGSADQIQTTVVDVLPVKAAALRRPDGQTVAADQIDRDRNVYNEDTGYGPNLGVGVAGGSNGGVSSGI